MRRVLCISSIGITEMLICFRQYTSGTYYYSSPLQSEKSKAREGDCSKLGKKKKKNHRANLYLKKNTINYYWNYSKN